MTGQLALHSTSRLYQALHQTQNYIGGMVTMHYPYAAYVDVGRVVTEPSAITSSESCLGSPGTTLMAGKSTSKDASR